jgi:hypothetical protein
VSLIRFLPAVVAVLVSAGLWALGISLMPVGERGDYAVMVYGGAVPDRELRERLESQGFSGLISESSQQVLLDSFGSIELIALDEYETRVLPFDPRNDGYAEKLRSLFVQDDHHFIYIPLKFPSVNAAGFEKKVALALGNIPYGVHHARSPVKPAFSLLLWCLAAVVLGIIRPARLALRPHTFCLIPCLPALAPLALGGAVGFSLASLLAGCAVLLVEPCYNRFSHLRLLYRQRMPPLLKLLPPLLVICYGVIAFFSGLSPVFAALVLVFFAGIFLFSVWSTAGEGSAGTVWGDFLSRRRRHQRFVPIPILTPRVSHRRFTWVMLPFAAIAFVLVCVDMVAPVSAPADFPLLPSPDTVTAADYQRHYRFQSTFSLRTLHEPFADNGMALYEFAPDGLLAQMVSDGTALQNETAPPFPLTDLLDYLNAGEHRTRTLYAVLVPLFPLLIIAPAFICKRKKLLAYTRH